MHVVDTLWKPEEGGYSSGLLVWNEEKEVEFHQLNPGDKISWSIEGPRRCIGRRDSEHQLIPCPNEQQITNRRKCPDCALLDEVDPCVRCTGERCTASRERFERCKSSPYVVYLALFGQGIVKVGVSSAARFLTRWVEQGADYAAIIAKTVGGDTARRLESEIGKDPCVAKAISGSKKKASLLEVLDCGEACRVIESFRSSIECADCLDDIEVIDLQRYYKLDGLDAAPSSVLPSSSSIAGQQLFGTVLGMKGPLLVTFIGHSYSVINLKKLIGYKIETGIRSPIKAQAGLLDFI